MYIKNQDLILQNSNCDNCKNKGICMFRAEFKKLDKIVSEIKIDFASPFKVTTTCKKYEKQAERQDGFYVKR